MKKCCKIHHEKECAMLMLILLLKLHTVNMFSIVNELDIVYQLGLQEKLNSSENTTETNQSVNHESFYKIIDKEYDKNEFLHKSTGKEETKYYC